MHRTDGLPDLLLLLHSAGPCTLWAAAWHPAPTGCRAAARGELAGVGNFIICTLQHIPSGYLSEAGADVIDSVYESAWNDVSGITWNQYRWL